MKPIELLQRIKLAIPDMKTLIRTIYGILSFQAVMIVVGLVLYLTNNWGYILTVILVISAGWIFLSLAFFLLVIRRRRENQEFEEKILIVQLDHSDRLIHLTESLFRQYRNHLQVISMRADKGEMEEIKTYISNLAVEMTRLKFTGIENPIFMAVILYHKIIAWEKGIDVMVFTNSPLYDCLSQTVLLEQVIGEALKILVDNEELTKSISRLVYMDVVETINGYIFEFNNSEEALDIFKSRKLVKIQKPVSLGFNREGLEKFKLVFKLIEKMGVAFDYKSYGGFVSELKVWVKK
jgi:hypothetical protein